MDDRPSTCPSVYHPPEEIDVLYRVEVMPAGVAMTLNVSSGNAHA